MDFGAFELERDAAFGERFAVGFLEVAQPGVDFAVDLVDRPFVRLHDGVHIRPSMIVVIFREAADVFVFHADLAEEAAVFRQQPGQALALGCELSVGAHPGQSVGFAPDEVSGVAFLDLVFDALRPDFGGFVGMIDKPRVTQSLRTRTESLADPLVLETQVIAGIAGVRRNDAEGNQIALLDVLIHVDDPVVRGDQALRILAGGGVFEHRRPASEILAIEERAELRLGKDGETKCQENKSGFHKTPVTFGGVTGDGKQEIDGLTVFQSLHGLVMDAEQENNRAQSARSR